MKNIINTLLCIAMSLTLFSCKKGDDKVPKVQNSTAFTAKVNGSLVTFNVLSATLLRDTDFDQKRLDITGTSEDGKLRLTFTVDGGSAEGNTVPVTNNSVKIFNEDNPNTSQDESLELSNSFFTIGQGIGNNSFTYDVFAENGNINISNSTSNGSTGTVSGTFSGTLESKLNGTDFTLAEGSFNALQYIIVN